jgi:transcriptional regulator with XRE-family HTH domain
VLQITQERRRRGWSQAELARRAKLDQSLLSKFESGWQRPYPCQLRRLARALGVPREFAARLSEEVKETDSASPAAITGTGAPRPDDAA